MGTETLELRITGKQENIEGDEGVSCQVQSILASIENQNSVVLPLRVGQFIDIPFEFDKIKIIDKNGEEIQLPENLLNRLMVYLKNQSSFEQMQNDGIVIDCNTFVSFLYEISFKDRGELFNKLDIKSFKTEKKLNPEDVVFIDGTLIDKNNSDYHFAIYLGKGLYISKFTNKNIGITSLNELNNFYGGGIIHRLTPKTKAS